MRISLIRIDDRMPGCRSPYARTAVAAPRGFSVGDAGCATVGFVTLSVGLCDSMYLGMYTRL